ncbi:MAG TPA: glycoside hydrolase family 16 protein [Actinomycetota bacterium]|nr:glycoside hydrolase family 16 protein [Actinomycetota bacterium]
MRRPGAIIIGVLTVLGFLIPLAEAASAPVDSFPSTAVGVALTPGGQGWWVAGANGSVTPGGNAPFYGSVAGIPLGRPVVGIAATPGGHGYWLVASDGGIFSFGDAAFFGSTGSIRLNKPIVGMASTPGGHGYWLVASNGGIFSFGDAAFFGSTGSLALNKPIVGIATSHAGRGYWLIATDGGIFSFGDAAFFGSTGSIRLNKPIVGGTATSDDRGYWLVASDGGIFSFGDAPFSGSGAGGSLAAPVVGMATSGAGYALATANGLVAAFGTAAAALGVPAGQPQGTPGETSSPGQPTGSGGAGTPSGEAMPTGDLPGWKMVFSDDFTGSSLNRRAWGAYNGQPGGDPGGWWDPSHVVVGNGMLELQNYQDPAFGNRWVSGGVSSAPALKQTYGKYLVRFRVDRGNGISGIALLWPSSGGWPPEIDFAEDGGGNRSHTTATLHYGSGNSQVQRSVPADFSQWHTIGVEWTAGLLTYTLDGTVWAAVASANVPAVPMEMDMQTQSGTCGDQWAPCPDASTPTRVNMQVDWVVAYKP